MDVLKKNSKIRRNSIATIGVTVIVTSYLNEWWIYVLSCLLLIGVLRYESSQELKRFFKSIWFVYFAGFILLLAGGADREMTLEVLGNVALVAGFFFPIFIVGISVIPYFQIKWLLPYEMRTFKRAASYVFFGWLLFLIMLIGLMHP
ncbi:hypothetical protein QUF49_03360 [Fictibacillus sp. b24]|uniref:hypothetical protein n=1 Tax=Fictibacillus sp. b24 TaxID=3055863 RepID=UPI0025A0F5D4|nr:hypothetical protein [Fictibacillus sp. b24]MDM5315017.1 hypothetical protein [Fictibacillus sp. b24]